MTIHLISFSKLKKFVFFFAFILICQISTAQPVGSGDWSRIREYGHSYNLNDFSDDEYDWIANHYNLFTIEKRHAKYVYGDVSSERASVATAAKIIANNSSAEPLFYWNVKVVYDEIYETIQEALALHPEWVDDDGWSYDDPACKAWMIDILTEYGTNSGHAGVFLDQVMAFPGSEEDIFEIMSSTPGIVIYNGYTPRGTESNPVIAATSEYLKYSSGVYVEHFLHGSHCKYLSQGKALLDSLLDVPNDKIIIAMSAPDTTYWNAPDYKFSLAAYLIIANDNSYYHYLSNGLLVSDYMMESIEEFDKKLGSPLSDATVDGYVYTRTFENAFVELDLENKTSSINWIENPIKDTVAIENLALFGTATQSSTLYDAEASRAIDGNTDGVFSNGSVTHTSPEYMPWWQVDLGANYNIGAISVFNREGESTIARLSDFTIYVLDEDSIVVDSTVYTTYPDPSVTTDAGGVEGRFVQVRLNGSGVLNLAEVQVAEVIDAVSSEEKNTVSIKVLDQNNSDSIALASLDVNNLVYTTNYIGEIDLELSGGEYPFSLSKAGYYTTNETLSITGDTTIVLELKALPEYTLSYKITDDSTNESLSEVQLLIDNQIYTSDSLGIISLLLYEGDYEYILCRTGYDSLSQSISIANDTIVDFQMDREIYNLVFQVKDAVTNQNLSDVSISINDSVYEIDAQEGLSLMLDYGVYAYSLSKPNYESISQSVDLNNDTVFVLLMDLESYDLTFQVNESSSVENISSTYIMVGDKTYLSNDQGELLLNLDYGEYDYTVSKDGYDGLEGTLFLSQDTTLTILLSLQTGINSFNADVIEIYPNPVKSILNINSEIVIDEVLIYDLLGSLIDNIEVHENACQLNVSAYKKGFYFLKLKLVNGGIVTTKIFMNGAD